MMDESELLEDIGRAPDEKALEELRVRLLGKSGEITSQLKSLGSLPVEERKSRGAELNKLKNVLATAIDERKSYLSRAALEERLRGEAVDITLPSRPFVRGRIHPVSHVIEELKEIFGNMGFEFRSGPDIEDTEHNFSALNFPDEHPAREMHDTFFIKSEGSNHVLRTHTSAVQIRTMRAELEGAQQAHMRIMTAGRTYRCDSDATHSPMFHQFEGICIEPGINMGHLKGCLQQALEEFFEVDNLPVRFRPSFFPFTEPSAEMDIGCRREKGRIVIGQGEDWLEVLGCGMVHPNVLKNSGVDDTHNQGFAFGMGVERLAMLKYGIPDLRDFFDNDTRWLAHYGFAAA